MNTLRELAMSYLSAQATVSLSYYSPDPSYVPPSARPSFYASRYVAPSPGTNPISSLVPITSTSKTQSRNQAILIHLTKLGREYVHSYVDSAQVQHFWTSNSLQRPAPAIGLLPQRGGSFTTAQRVGALRLQRFNADALARYATANSHPSGIRNLCFPTGTLPSGPALVDGMAVVVPRAANHGHVFDLIPADKMVGYRCQRPAAAITAAEESKAEREASRRIEEQRTRGNDEMYRILDPFRYSPTSSPVRQNLQPANLPEDIVRWHPAPASPAPGRLSCAVWGPPKLNASDTPDPPSNTRSSSSPSLLSATLWPPNPFRTAPSPPTHDSSLPTPTLDENLGAAAEEAAHLLTPVGRKEDLPQGDLNRGRLSGACIWDNKLCFWTKCCERVSRVGPAWPNSATNWDTGDGSRRADADLPQPRRPFDVISAPPTPDFPGTTTSSAVQAQAQGPPPRRASTSVLGDKGDWYCDECGLCNWARRVFCLRCCPLYPGNIKDALYKGLVHVDDPVVQLLGYGRKRGEAIARRADVRASATATVCACFGPHHGTGCARAAHRAWAPLAQPQGWGTYRRGQTVLRWGGVPTSAATTGSSGYSSSMSTPAVTGPSANAGWSTTRPYGYVYDDRYSYGYGAYGGYGGYHNYAGGAN